MAYSPSTLENVYSMMDGVWNIFRYISTDSIATVLGAGYITDYKSHHMQVGDLVFVVNQSTPVLTVCKVNSVNSTTGTATLTVADTAASTSPTFTNVTATGNLSVQGNAAIGDAVTDLVAFYGTTAISQRALAAQNTTTVGTASSTAVDTLTKAAIIEIMNTLTALGLWKGAA